jgi:hypothetical protein
MELMDCVAAAKVVAVDNGNTAFQQYLNASSPITDPTEREQCQTAKEYFGFDGDDPDETKICEEIERLRCTSDFAALDEFAASSQDTSTTNNNLIKPDKGEQRIACVRSSVSSAAVRFAHHCGFSYNTSLPYHELQPHTQTI